jgi:hypothetical protein
MNADEESDEGDKSEDDSSGEDEDAQSQQTDPFDNIEALSDEEAKEDLKQAQHLKLLEDSQVGVIQQCYLSVLACTKLIFWDLFLIKGA